MELADDDQRADACQHAVDDGGRDRAEIAAQTQYAGAELEQAGKHENGAKRAQPVVPHEFEDDDREAGGGAADLERGTGQKADDDTADDPRHQAFLGRDARGDGDAHAQRHRDEEDDDRGGEIACEVGERPSALGGYAHAAISVAPVGR